MTAGFPISITHVPDFIRFYQPAVTTIYMLTVTPGLETIAINEAEQKLAASVCAVMRGKVFITIPTPFAHHHLRCADNIYTLLCTGETGITRDALTIFGAALRSASFMLADEIIKSRLCKRRPTFTVNAAVSGKHSYSRFEAANAFSRVLEQEYTYLPGIPEARDIEFRLDIIGEHFMVSEKLTDAAFRFRGVNRQFGKAALRPTVAHALVWVAGITEKDDFLDPFCGSGTILCERAAYPFRRLIGNDYEAEAITHTRGNLFQIPAEAELYNGDFTALRLDNGSIDRIVTNPPWGNQIKTEDAKALYTSFMRLTDKWLKQNGIAVTLTPLADILERAAAGFVLETKALYTVSLHGTICYVYTITRK